MGGSKSGRKRKPTLLKRVTGNPGHRKREEAVGIAMGNIPTFQSDMVQLCGLVAISGAIRLIVKSQVYGRIISVRSTRPPNS